MTEAEALELVAMLFAAFAPQVDRLGEETADEMASAYARFLRDLPREQAAAAVHGAIRSKTYLPTIGELRHIALRGSWAAAWADVCAAVSSRGGRRPPPEWPDPRTSFALQTIGWTTLCNAHHREMGTLRAQFRQAWESAQQIALERGLPAVAERVGYTRRIAAGAEPCSLGDAIAGVISSPGRDTKGVLGS